jgi:predicted CoA-binding protein
MKVDFQNNELINRILEESHTIAVIGLSAKPDRPSYDVAAFLQSKQYRIIPVNPNLSSILGEKSYPDLSSIPEPVDVVDIFRKSEDVGPIVDEAIKVGAKTIWMQLGIVNEEAAKKAQDAGLNVIMDRCMKREFERIHK